MKDYKGYEIKTKMDRQDSIVLIACAVATVILALVLYTGA